MLKCIPTCLAALLVVAATTADEAKTQTISADGLSFQAPESWAKSKPTSSMRKAQLTAPAAKGDADKTELVMFVFPGGAGGVQANVDRWRSQFKDADGKAPAVETKTVKGKNTDVTRVETSGTFTDSLNRIGPKPGYHLLGAIVTTRDAGYFLKMVGPEKSMAEAEGAFDALIKTIEVGKE